MKFKDDPEQRYKQDDEQIAWSIGRFVLDGGTDPIRVVMFPMAKAVL